MKRSIASAWLVALYLGSVLMLAGQQPDSASSPSGGAGDSASDSVVPRLIQFSGVVKDATGKVMTGSVSLTFSLYELQEGGSPLWAETQKTPLDDQGHYTVLLGAAQPDGLPLDLFTTGKARWLGVQPQLPGEGEEPRVLLVGMPYALKAADADTLGGKPASAYVTTDSQMVGSPTAVPASTAAGTQALNQALTAASSAQSQGPLTVSGSGTTNFIPIWTNSTTLGNSTIFETSKKVGIGNTTPQATLDVTGGALIRGALQLPSTGTANATQGFNSQPADWLASAFNSSTHAAVNQHFRWQAEPVNNNTTSPSGKFNLLFGSGSNTPAETGLSINNQGQFIFASGQAFPGGTVTSNETVDGNLTAKQLISNVATGTPPLKVSSTTQVANLNASELGGFAAGAFAKLSGGNSFTGNQSVTGDLSASGAVYGTLLSAVTSVGNAVEGTTSAAGYGAVFGGSTGGGFGVYGSASGSSGMGVYGESYATGGNSAGGPDGVHGVAHTTAGSGVAGINLASGTGVSGTGGQIGVAGTSTASGGIAGFFNNTGGGSILIGAVNGQNKFNVDTNANVVAYGGFQTPGTLLAGSGVTAGATSGNVPTPGVLFTPGGGADYLIGSHNQNTSPGNNTFRIDNGGKIITVQDFINVGAGSGVILTSPSGNCYRIFVNDDGSLGTSPIIPCPTPP